MLDTRPAAGVQGLVAGIHRSVEDRQSTKLRELTHDEYVTAIERLVSFEPITCT